MSESLEQCRAVCLWSSSVEYDLCGIFLNEASSLVVVAGKLVSNLQVPQGIVLAGESFVAILESANPRLSTLVCFQMAVQTPFIGETLGALRAHGQVRCLMFTRMKLAIAGP